MGRLRCYLLILLLISFNWSAVYADLLEEAVDHYRINGELDKIYDFAVDTSRDGHKKEADAVVLYCYHIWLSKGQYEKITGSSYHPDKGSTFYYNLMMYRAHSLYEQNMHVSAIPIYSQIIEVCNDLVLVREAALKIIEIAGKTSDTGLLYRTAKVIDAGTENRASFVNLMTSIGDQEQKNKKYKRAVEAYLEIYSRKYAGRIKNCLKRIDSKELKEINKNRLLFYYIDSGEYREASGILKQLEIRRKNIPFYSHLLKELAKTMEYSQGGKDLWERIQKSNKASSEKLYKEIFRKYPICHYAEKAIFKASAEYITEKKYNNAINIYNIIASSRFFSDNYGLFITRAGILHLMDKKKKEALDYFYMLTKLESNDYSAIGRYFAAKILLEMGNDKEAEKVLKESLSNNNNTYYSLKAEELIKTHRIKMKGLKESLYKNMYTFIKRDDTVKQAQYLYRISKEGNNRKLLKKYAEIIVKAYIQTNIRHGKEKMLESGNIYYEKYLILKKTDELYLIEPYLHFIYKSENNQYIKSEYIKFLHQWDQNLKAIAEGTAWINSLDFRIDIRVLPEPYRSILFPVMHREIIERNSKTIDPVLVKSLIRQESGFNKYAVSPRNAVGLMQILHSTARDVSKKHGIRYGRRNELFDEELNIRIGIKYFEEMIDRYGNINHALSAYNAGGRNANRWIAMYDKEDMDIYNFIVTYKETRDYVQLILRNYIIYKSILNE